jgi:hypothetical protein
MLLVNSKNNITNIEKWTELWNTEMTSEDAREVGDHVWRYLLGDWSKVRQNKVLIAILRAACVAVLTWGFIDSIVDSLAVIGVWIWTSLTYQNFLSSSTDLMNWNTMWQITNKIFLQSCTFFSINVEPIVFVVKAIGTLVFVPYYENLVCTVESICFSKEYRYKYPMVSRVQGLILTFFTGYLFVRTVTILGMIVGTTLGTCKHRILSFLLFKK